MPNQPIQIKNSLNKTIDNLVRRKIPGLFLSLLFRKQNAGNSKPLSFNHIVFLRPGKLGDMLVATPLFHAVKKEMVNVRITVICSPYNNAIIKNNPDIDNIKIANFHSFLKMIGLFRWIVRNRADLVIDLTPEFSRTTTLLSLFLRNAQIKTAGMHKGEFAKYFDINAEPEGMHIIDRNRVLLETVLSHKFNNSDFRPLIYATDVQKSFATDFISNSCDSKCRLGINLSAGANERQWSFDNYLSLVKMINIEFGDKLSIILFSHGEQRNWAEKIAKTGNIKVVPNTDIPTIAEILKACNILFTPDTVFLHLASAVKVPVVALYGTSGENFVRWRSFGVLSKDLIAGENKTVNEISVEKAFVNLKEMVNSLNEMRESSH